MTVTGISPYDRCLCGGQRRFCGDHFDPAPRTLAALSDLARRYRVSKSTVHEWADRDDFPPPLGVVATRVRVWLIESVDSWCSRRGVHPRTGSTPPKGRG